MKHVVLIDRLPVTSPPPDVLSPGSSLRPGMQHMHLDAFIVVPSILIWGGVGSSRLSPLFGPWAKLCSSQEHHLDLPDHCAAREPAVPLQTERLAAVILDRISSHVITRFLGRKSDGPPRAFCPRQTAFCLCNSLYLLLVGRLCSFKFFLEICWYSVSPGAFMSTTHVVGPSPFSGGIFVLSIYLRIFIPGPPLKLPSQ